MSFRLIILRNFSSAPGKSGKNLGKYFKTVNLPKTKFQIWLNADRRVLLDNEILKSAGFSELYSWQRENLTGEEFILHDGPPYANGFPHMGHAVNKIVKDIIIRNKVLRGQKVHYVPGWDCHGLPIELKATQGLQSKKLSPLEIRNRARRFATQTIGDQREIFKNWGTMADWSDSGCYHTFDKDFVKNEIRQFWKLYQEGLVYRDLKPVYWSPSSRTALAEAELEYNEEHESTAIIVKMAVTNSNICKSGAHLLIWTTTPWTLPGNVAVAVGPDIVYCVVTDATDYFVVAKDLIDSLCSKLGKKLTVVSEFLGTQLEGTKYLNVNGEECPVILGAHVTSTSGTGLVHTAPAHGHDDFLLARQFNLPIKCIVDKAGYFNDQTDLRGHHAVSNDVILAKISENILHKETYVHSYPYDWRTKKPVIIRASMQWFIDTEKLKQSALNALENVEVIPTGASALRNKVDSRPYWCISRQRVWGVPIPVLYDKDDNTIISQQLIDKCCDLVDQHGTDFWWSLPASEITHSEDLHLGKDILDIWFDSGLTWSQVLGEKTADLYVEGKDQFTGWFQSSLLTSVALKNKAPYKKILVHGFAVDQHGRKMSKSLGNVTDPGDLISGTGGGRGKPYGLDIIRWWVGEHSLGSQKANITVSPTTLADSSDSIFKIRNSCRFLLGSLLNFDLPEEVPKLYLIDHYILHCALDLIEQCDIYYDNFQFNKVCSSVKHFIANDLSSVYCHAVKDRLYCEEAKGDTRVAAQFTFYHLLTILNRVVAPIVPVLAEEVNGYLSKTPFFYRKNPVLSRDLLASRLKVFPVVEQALAVKAAMAKDVPVNTSSLEVNLEIQASDMVYKILKILHRDDDITTQLEELLQVSSVNLVLNNSIDGFFTKVSMTDMFLCERCRRYCSESKTDLCSRCTVVVKAC